MVEDFVSHPAPLSPKNPDPSKVAILRTYIYTSAIQVPSPLHWRVQGFLGGVYNFHIKKHLVLLNWMVEKNHGEIDHESTYKPEEFWWLKKTPEECRISLDDRSQCRLEMPSSWNRALRRYLPLELKSCRDGRVVGWLYGRKEVCFMFGKKISLHI